MRKWNALAYVVVEIIMIYMMDFVVINVKGFFVLKNVFRKWKLIHE